MNYKRPILTNFSQVAPLLMQKYERYLPTAFDESMSLLEKVNKLIHHANAVGDLTNDLLDKWNEVMVWVMNDGLESAVIDKLDKMVQDGTLDDIINVAIFEDLNNEINTKASQDQLNQTNERVSVNEKFRDNTLIPTAEIRDINSTRRHVPVMTNTETYDRSGTNVHPSILYIENGFGAEKWRYVMGYTPMGERDDRNENPSFAVSHDGLIWKTPEGLNNPVVNAPPNENDHNSDAEIVYFNNEIYMYYRETRRSTTQDRLYMVRSGDGVSWTNPVQVVPALSTGYLSPSVINDGGVLNMFVVTGGNIQTATSRDGVNWSAFTVCNVYGLPANLSNWHISVNKNDDRWELILNAVDHSINWYYLHYGYSTDAGQTWNVNSQPIIEHQYSWESYRLYRACLLPIHGQNDVYDFWYASLDENEVQYRMSYTSLIRKDNQLYPISPTNRKWVTMDSISTPSLMAGSIATQKLVVGGKLLGEPYNINDLIHVEQLNGWEHLQNASYYKDPNGIIRMEGRLVAPSDGSATADGTYIGRIQWEYRPQFSVIFRQPNADIGINQNGDISIYNYDPRPQTSYVSLDGIFYRGI